MTPSEALKLARELLAGYTDAEILPRQTYIPIPPRPSEQDIIDRHGAVEKEIVEMGATRHIANHAVAVALQERRNKSRGKK